MRVNLLRLSSEDTNFAFTKNYILNVLYTIIYSIIYSIYYIQLYTTIIYSSLTESHGIVAHLLFTRHTMPRNQRFRVMRKNSSRLLMLSSWSAYARVLYACLCRKNAWTITRTVSLAITVIHSYHKFFPLLKQVMLRSDDASGVTNRIISRFRCYVTLHRSHQSRAPPLSRNTNVEYSQQESRESFWVSARMKICVLVLFPGHSEASLWSFTSVQEIRG